jgi:hypothetical protein
MQPPEYFREKAEETRARASEMTTEHAQRILTVVAKQYDRLAEVAEREESRKPTV